MCIPPKYMGELQENWVTHQNDQVITLNTNSSWREKKI